MALPIFMGGELEDFTPSGAVSFSTAAAAYRSAYARGACSMTTTSGASLSAPFGTPSALFFTTARVFVSGALSTTPFLWFSTGGAARLRLRPAGTSPAALVLETYNGTAAATLATSTPTIAVGNLYRLDMAVDYQAAGRVRVWVDGVLYLDYSGNVTAAGATALDGMVLSSTGATGTTYWSEVVIAPYDLRSMAGLRTIQPDSTGDLSQWVGGWPDVDESAASETDVLTASGAGLVHTVNCSGMPSGAGNLTVRAVKVTVSACRGAGGPQSIDLGLRQSSTNAFGTTKALQAGYTVLTETWETNPITGAAFTSTEIDNLQLAFRSVA